MFRRLLVLFLLAWPVSAQETAPLPVATVASVSTAEVIARIAVAGTLVARDEALVVPQVTGFPIRTLDHEVGDTVEKGDVMATLDDRTLAAQALQAKAELARARAAVSQAQSQIDSAAANADQTGSALTRTRTLREGGTSTQSILDQALAADLTAQASLRAAQDGLAVAQAQVQQAEAARDIAELNLSNAVIRAPVSGVISARFGQVGAIAAAAGEPLYRIIENGTIEVEADVVETALGQVAVGDAAEMRVAGIGTIEGTVRRVSPTVSAMNRLGTIRIAVEAEGLRPGLFASGWVVTARRSSPTVPSAAVLTDADGDYALRVDGDGMLDRAPVTAGLIWNGRREIASGLDLGDKVIARAGAFFAAGDRIDPQEQAPEAVR